MTVRDPGVGHQPELLPSVFDLFTQVDSTNDLTSGGLGIGLARTGRLRWSCTADDRRDQRRPGTRQRVHRSSPRPSHRQFVDMRPFRNRHNRTRLTASTRVLVVDDNADAADTISLLLSELARRTDRVRRGCGARHQRERFRPRWCSWIWACLMWIWPR